MSMSEILGLLAGNLKEEDESVYMNLEKRQLMNNVTAMILAQSGTRKKDGYYLLC